jgi:DMSO/TMAO reductase YedYZ molybdopterin-dependent catalytic subunit
MTTTMTTTMTTKPQVVRPVANWTKQIVSFGTSFAFFGLAGLLQTQAQAAQQAAAEEAAALAAAQATATQAAVVVVPDPAETELLGPVQPVSDTNPIPAQTTVVEPAPAPAPAPVDGHTSAS